MIGLCIYTNFCLSQSAWTITSSKLIKTNIGKPLTDFPSCIGKMNQKQISEGTRVTLGKQSKCWCLLDFLLSLVRQT